MPQVTSIENQKKNPKRVNVFLDGQFGFGLSKERAFLEKVKVGLQLTPVAINQLLINDYYDIVLNHSIEYLSRRPHSEKEIADNARKYIQKKYPEFESGIFAPVLDKVLEKLRALKQVNDEEFALWWLEQRERDHKSERVVRQELFQKGISKDIISSLFERAEGDDLAKALIVAAKKLPSYRSDDPDKKRERLTRFLASKGFDWDTISIVLKRMLDGE